jgi:protocatechuate 4,5-dioxygenase beta chain
MARIMGGLGTSHVPAIANAISKRLYDERYPQPFFAGYPPVHDWLHTIDADVAVVFFNDHGLNFFLDATPTFAIGAADEYHSAGEGWGIGQTLPFLGNPRLSRHIADAVVSAGFELTTCEELRVDHGVWIPIDLFWPVRPAGLQVVPIHINTVQHPLPTAARCEGLGVAVGDAIRSFSDDLRVVVIGSGGLSHQLEGKRAGFINREFDEQCLAALVSDDRSAITRHSNCELIELAGSQGVEIVDWLAMRGALSGDVAEIHRNYHIPISNTAAGLLAIEPVGVRSSA